MTDSHPLSLRSRSPLYAFALSICTLLVLGCSQVEAGSAERTPPSEPWAGADSFVKPSDEDLRERLTELQYRVTQHEGTEPPFRNDYWDNKQDGIYVDIVSGEPLFSSKDKYKSGTGWPSFVRPLVDDNIVARTDYKIGYARTEIRSKHADSHLGHVFEDGPRPTGLRYCMNSAALRFVAVEDLEAEGYGEFAALFADGEAGSDDGSND